MMTMMLTMKLVRMMMYCGCTIVNMVSEAGGTMAMMTRLIKTMMMTFRARMITMMKMMIV